MASDGAAVSKVEPARHLAVIALWELRDSGDIGLAEYHEKQLDFIRSHGVRATCATDCALAVDDGATLTLAVSGAPEQATTTDDPVEIPDSSSRGPGLSVYFAGPFPAPPSASPTCG